MPLFRDIYQIGGNNNQFSTSGQPIHVGVNLWSMKYTVYRL